jgi:predicted lipoprotein with Yx(FWY)xxD motif
MRQQLLLATVLSLNAPAIHDVAHANGQAKLGVATSPQHGAYLTNGKGLALYSFSNDRAGTGDSPPAVNCRGTCLEIWTPLFTKGTAVAGSEVRSSLIGTMSLNGDKITTYGGWPLYRYIVDNEPGDTEGHGMASFNGRWHLMAPDGTPATIR